MQNVTGSNNSLTYYSRYNRIDKYEIYDHNTNLLFSGATNIIGNGSKIYHSGITYTFDTNNYYTYKAYYISGATYLSNQTMLQSTYVEPAFFKEVTKTKNTFKINK